MIFKSYSKMISGKLKFTIIASCIFAFFSQYRLTTFRYSSMLYLLILVFIPVTTVLLSRKAKITVNLNSIIVCLFAITMFLGILSSAKFTDSFFSALGKTLLFILFFYLSRKKDWYPLFRKCIYIAVSVFILMAYLELIMPDVINGINRVIMTNESYETVSKLQSQGYRLGICNQASYFAFNIASLTVFVFSSLLFINNKKIAKVCVIALCLGAMMMSGKRAELFSIVLALGLGVALLMLSIKTSMKKKIQYGFFLVLFIAVAYFLLFESSLGILLFEKGLSFDYDTTRTMLTQRALSLWESSPILGVGTNYFSQGFDYSAHNSYLQLLCENGIVGLILFILFLTYNFVVTMKAMKTTQMNDGKKSYVCASLMFQVFFITSSYFESMFANNVMWIIYLVFSAMPVAIMRNQNDIQLGKIVTGEK